MREKQAKVFFRAGNCGKAGKSFFRAGNYGKAGESFFRAGNYGKAGFSKIIRNPSEISRNRCTGQSSVCSVWPIPNCRSPRYGPYLVFSLDHTKQTEDWIWARPISLTIVYGPDGTDRRLRMGHSEQTEERVCVSPNRPTTLYGPDRRLDMGLTEKRDARIWARQNITNLRIGQTEQTQFRYGPNGAARPKICPNYEPGRT